MENLIVIDGKPLFIVETGADKSYCLTFEVYEVNDWDKDNKPVGDEIYMKGSIKWDGCCNIFFGDENGYVHICAQVKLDYMKEVLDAIWLKAKSEVVHWDE